MATKRTLSYPRRGEVYLVRFDPTMGAEIKKTRPALILQNDIGNRYSPTTIVAAITSKSGDTVYPTEVPIKAKEGGLDVDSLILLNHIRTIDKARLLKRFGKVRPATLDRVDTALQISLGLIDF